MQLQTFCITSGWAWSPHRRSLSPCPPQASSPFRAPPPLTAQVCQPASHTCRSPPPCPPATHPPAPTEPPQGWLGSRKAPVQEDEWESGHSHKPQQLPVGQPGLPRATGSSWQSSNVNCSFSDNMLLIHSLVWLAAGKRCDVAQRVHGATV